MFIWFLLLHICSSEKGNVQCSSVLKTAFLLRSVKSYHVRNELGKGIGSTFCSEKTISWESRCANPLEHEEYIGLRKSSFKIANIIVKS
jgi:hypothetical protein